MGRLGWLVLVGLCACGGEEREALEAGVPYVHHCDVWARGLDSNPLELEPPTRSHVGPYCTVGAPDAAAQACAEHGEAGCFASCRYGGPRC